MASVTIPESAYPAIQALVHLSSEEFELLLNELAQADAAATPYQFAEQIAAKSQRMKASTVKVIVNELFKLISFKEDSGKTLPDFASSIANSALAIASKDFAFNEDNRDVLRDRLIRIFEAKGPLALSAKALDLLTDAQNLFFSAKMLSDIRPVFSEDGTVAEATVLVHHLLIHYRNGNDHKDFFVTLDNNDLKQLRGVLDRAERKEATLKPLLRRLEVPYLEVETG